MELFGVQGFPVAKGGEKKERCPSLLDVAHLVFGVGFGGRVYGVLSAGEGGRGITRTAQVPTSKSVEGLCMNPC